MSLWVYGHKGSNRKSCTLCEGLAVANDCLRIVWTFPKWIVELGLEIAIPNVVFYRCSLKNIKDNWC